MLSVDQATQPTTQRQPQSTGRACLSAAQQQPEDHQPEDPQRPPKMCDVIRDEVAPQSPYSKVNFVQHLLKSHCIENLDFYLMVSSLLEHYDCQHERGDGRSSSWTELYRHYIEPEIVNLPAQLTSQTNAEEIPEKRVLKKMRTTMANYLHMSYQQFTHEVSTSCCGAHNATTATADSTAASTASNTAVATPTDCNSCLSTSPDGSSAANPRTVPSAPSSFDTDDSVSTYGTKQSGTCTCCCSTETPLPARKYSVSSTSTTSASSSSGLGFVSTKTSHWNKLGRKFHLRRSTSTSSS